MVINGGSRGGAGELGSHLARVDTNERMEVREIRGLATDNMREGLRQMEGIAAGTRCRKSLYHANINPGPNEAPLTPEQELRAIDLLEQRRGMVGHPRIVVAHVKHGRAHLHVVWSRIDQTTMRAVSDSHNYRTHEQVARQLEREFGHAQVRGAHEREDRPRPPRAAPSAELQQAARTKQDPTRIAAEVTRLWRGADSGQAFATALDAAGYVLAQGDRRGYVVIDQAGGVHSLARRIEGVNSKDVTARLAGVELANLPTADQARAIQRDRALPARERPAGRLAGELTRPADERADRTAALTRQEERDEAKRQQIRADLDRHLRDQAAKPRPAPEMARGEAERPAAPEAPVPRRERTYTPPDGPNGPDFQQQLADSAEYRRERAETTRANDNRPAAKPVQPAAAKEVGRALGRGAGLLGTGLGKASGGLLGLIGRVLGAASSSRPAESREKQRRQSVPAQLATPARLAPAPPRRSAADELADRARSRANEDKPSAPQPTRQRERQREPGDEGSAFTARPGLRFLGVAAPAWWRGWHVMDEFSRIVGLTPLRRPRHHTPV